MMNLLSSIRESMRKKVEIYSFRTRKQRAAFIRDIKARGGLTWMTSETTEKRFLIAVREL